MSLHASDKIAYASLELFYIPLMKFSMCMGISVSIQSTVRPGIPNQSSSSSSHSLPFPFPIPIPSIHNLNPHLPPLPPPRLLSPSPRHPHQRLQRTQIFSTPRPPHLAIPRSRPLDPRRRDLTRLLPLFQNTEPEIHFDVHFLSAFGCRCVPVTERGEVLDVPFAEGSGLSLAFEGGVGGADGGEEG